MGENEVITQYKNADDKQKRKILKNNSVDLDALIKGLNQEELVKLAELHPYKEKVCDVILNKMRNYEMAMSDVGKNYDIIKAIENTKKQGFFSRIIDRFRGRDSKLIEGMINHKIVEIKKLNNLIGKAQFMRDDYWKLDIIDENGNYKEQTQNAEVDLHSFENVVNKKVNDLYWEKAVKKYRSPRKDQAQEFYGEAYEGLFDDDKKELAKLFGITELTERDGNYMTESRVSIDSVNKVEDFTIDDKNFGEVFLVDKVFKFHYSSKKETDIYKKNKENGQFELIGSKQHGYDKDFFKINKAGKEIKCPADEVKYEPKVSLTANEVHNKALVDEMQQGLGENFEIAEISQVEIPNKADSVFVVRTVDNNNNSKMEYKLVQLNSNPKEGFIGSVETAKIEHMKNINLPTVHSTPDVTTRDKVKVDATINFKGEKLQIYTDRHGKSRVAEIVDRNNAYPLITRSLYKNNGVIEKTEVKTNDFQPTPNKEVEKPKDNENIR